MFLLPLADRGLLAPERGGRAIVGLIEGQKAQKDSSLRLLVCLDIDNALLLGLVGADALPDSPRGHLQLRASIHPGRVIVEGEDFVVDVAVLVFQPGVCVPDVRTLDVPGLKLLQPPSLATKLKEAVERYRAKHQLEVSVLVEVALVDVGVVEAFSRRVSQRQNSGHLDLILLLGNGVLGVRRKAAFNFRLGGGKFFL